MRDPDQVTRGGRADGWWQADDGRWYPPSLAFHPAARHDPAADQVRRRSAEAAARAFVRHLAPRWVGWLAPIPLVCLLAFVAASDGQQDDRVEILEPAVVPSDPPRPDPGTTPFAGSTASTGSSPTTVYPAPTMITAGRARLDESHPPVAPPRPVPRPAPPAPPTTVTTVVKAGATTTTTAPAPATPRSADDCKDGGWQHLVDSAGQPFANQGECVSYVTRGG
jgi:hypothetical protein